MSGDAYSYSPRWGRPRKEPAQDAQASLYETCWSEVPDFYWSKLTRHAAELTMATWGIGVVGDRLVQFAGH